MTARPRQPSGTAEGRVERQGFSLLEVLISLVILLAVMGIVFTFFVNVSEESSTESAALEAQQASRLALDDMGRTVLMTGYGISRTKADNEASWQRDVVHAGAYTLAMNADIDPKRGALDATQTLEFPGSDDLDKCPTCSYTGEGSPSATGAETYVFTLDADADGAITDDDRTDVEAGAFNPAADTETALDFGVFRREYGFEAAGEYGGALDPITGYLFTNATDDSVYPDGSVPAPLFTYWLTEDLDGDDKLADTECVVTDAPCDDRDPQLYMWGDTDFDGELSDTERVALRDMPVGSPAWAGNKLADGGDYVSTTLTDQAKKGDNYILKVNDTTGFGPGDLIQVGSDGTKEEFVIESVDTVASKVTVTSAISTTHAASEEVVITPRTLLRAIRAVQLNFEAITPRAETRGPGRAGRQGTKGLEQRVRPFVRKIQLRNLTTAAAKNTVSVPTGKASCPVSIDVDKCGGSLMGSPVVYIGRTEAVALPYIVTKDGTGVDGLEVKFKQLDVNLGTITGNAVTNGLGQASVGFTPKSTMGTATIEARTDCTGSDGLPETKGPAKIDVDIAQVSITAATDCRATFVKDGDDSSPPSLPFTIKTEHSSGALASQKVTVELAFDSGLEKPADFAKVQAELFLGGTSKGKTSTTDGSFTPANGTTDGSGLLAGSVNIAKDDLRAGVRVILKVTVTDEDCKTYGATVTKNFNFDRLLLGTLNYANCTDSLPCTIVAGGVAPKVTAKLSRNGNVIKDIDIKFTANKVGNVPPNGQPVMKPASGIVHTDGAGTATMELVHNNAADITPATPLKVNVTATTGGPATECASGSTIAAHTPIPGYKFEGSVVAACSVEIVQSNVVRNPPADKFHLCVRIKNKGTCPVRIKGLKITYDNPPLAAQKYSLIKGGSVVNPASCSILNTVKLFDPECNVPKDQPLNNDTQWNFFQGGQCSLPPEPPNPVPPGSFFVLDDIKVVTSLVAGKVLRISVTFQCDGGCSSGEVETTSFQLATP